MGRYAAQEHRRFRRDVAAPLGLLAAPLDPHAGQAMHFTVRKTSVAAAVR
jgi:hypothetical protein